MGYGYLGHSVNSGEETSACVSRMYYHRNKIKDTLQGSVRRFEYHGHPPTKYHQIPIRLSARCFDDVIGFRTSNVVSPHIFCSSPSVGGRTNLKFQIQIGGIFVAMQGETCVWLWKYQLLISVWAGVRCRIY